MQLSFHSNVISISLRFLLFSAIFCYIADFGYAIQLKVEFESGPIAIGGTPLSVVETSNGGFMILAVDLSQPKVEHTLHVVSDKGRVLRQVLRSDAKNGGFLAPFKLVVAPSRNQIWMADMGQPRIFVYTEDGSLIETQLVRRPSHGVHDLAFSKMTKHLFTAGCVAKNVVGESGCSSRIQEYEQYPQKPLRTFLPNFENLDFLHRGYYKLSLASLAVSEDNQIAFGDTPERRIEIINLGSGKQLRIGLEGKIPAMPEDLQSISTLPFVKSNTLLGGLFYNRGQFLVALRRFDGKPVSIGIVAKDKIQWLDRNPGLLVGINAKDQLLFARQEGKTLRIAKAVLR